MRARGENQKEKREDRKIRGCTLID